jgi:hypothetical protein
MIEFNNSRAVEQRFCILNAHFHIIVTRKVLSITNSTALKRVKKHEFCSKDATFSLCPVNTLFFLVWYWKYKLLHIQALRFKISSVYYA